MYRVYAYIQHTFPHGRSVHFRFVNQELTSHTKPPLRAASRGWRYDGGPFFPVVWLKKLRVNMVSESLTSHPICILLDFISFSGDSTNSSDGWTPAPGGREARWVRSFRSVATFPPPWCSWPPTRLGRMFRKMVWKMVISWGFNGISWWFSGSWWWFNGIEGNLMQFKAL